LFRFHIDGLQLIGKENAQSKIEMIRSRITDQIVPSGNEVTFPEDALTEDEKCALFFTISHTINETARYDKDIKNIYRSSKNEMMQNIIENKFFIY
jgi:hypothetical protein